MSTDKCRTDKMSTEKMNVTPRMQNTEETIANNAVDYNLFRLGSINLFKKIQHLEVFWLEAKPPPKNNYFEK